MNITINKNNSLLNQTYDSNIETPFIILFFGYIDFLTRISFFIAHFVYFIIVCMIDELKKITYFQMHHINICGLFQSILYVSWLGSVVPSLNNDTWNYIVCQISEFCSSVFKYSRSYSILVLAAYRLIAVYKLNEYKIISKSYKYTVLTGILVWLIPILIFFINKYSTNSGPGYYCADGNSITNI